MSDLSLAPELIARLRDCSLFRSLTSAEMTLVAALAAEERLAAGAPLIRRGELGKHLYIVDEGWLHLSVEDQDQGTRMFGPGDVYGLSAVVGPHRYSRNAVAASDCRVIAIPAERLRELVTHDPALGSRFWHDLARILDARLIDLIEQIAAFPTTPRRVAGADG